MYLYIYHSISGVGVPITSASKRIVFPSLPSASFNFFMNSGGVDAFGSLTLVNFDGSDGVPRPASFSATTRNS